MPPAAHPEVQMLVLCDHVYRCPETGKFSYLGTWSHLRMPATRPCPFGPASVAVVLVNGRGTTKLWLDLCTADEASMIFMSEPHAFSFAGPDDVVEIVFGVPRMDLKHPGDLRLRVWSDGQLIHSRKIVVKEKR